MSIDERLEKLGVDLEALKDRHEALTQSVELMQSTHNHHLGVIAHNFEVVLGPIKRLENIAGSRGRRIEDLEDRH
jgi:hypothetical protein